MRAKAIAFLLHAIQGGASGSDLGVQKFGRFQKLSSAQDKFSFPLPPGPDVGRSFK